MAFEITSTAFQPNGMIPTKYTCDGEDVSPPLAWKEAPAGTESFALISDDPDAPGKTWVHWVLYNVPATANGLPEGGLQSGVIDAGEEGSTDFGRVGYGGPCPPSGVHRYYFKLYALDTTLSLPSSTTRKDLEKAMQGHTLAQAELMGKYSRR